MVTHLHVKFEPPPYSSWWGRRKEHSVGACQKQRVGEEEEGSNLSLCSVVQECLVSLCHLFRHVPILLLRSLWPVSPQGRDFVILLESQIPWKIWSKDMDPVFRKEARMPMLAYFGKQFQRIHATPEAHLWIPSLKHLL